MNKKTVVFSLFVGICFISYGQSYTSYFTGNPNDTITYPMGGICLMGGATEDDNAMKWFLQRANGGDILVLRTSGSNGYNAYLYSGLGITVNSVETIVFHQPTASYEPYILQKIQQAEAIWFAGGDQWTYITYWRNTPIEQAINQAISQRNIVIGGTSAGMAIQGKYYFTAQNGTVTSAVALTNPYDNKVTIDSTKFINNFYLNHVITDTHFDNPDRKGRLMVFLARIYNDYGEWANAIACDEYTAVCIDNNGMARVFGSYPDYDDNAYFVQVNCDLSIQSPEVCTLNNPLTWNLGGLAVKAYQVKGDPLGTNTFDLNSWKHANGGNWYDWSVIQGNFYEQSGQSLLCSPTSFLNLNENPVFKIYPNPTKSFIMFCKEKNNSSLINEDIILYNSIGQSFSSKINRVKDDEYVVDLSTLPKGIYYLIVEENQVKKFIQKIIKE